MGADLIQFPKQDTDIAVYQSMDTGLDNFSRLVPTNLTLVQNTTRDPKGARPGQLLDELTGDIYDTIEFIPLTIRRGRVMFPPGELNLDAKPICRSSDGVVPAPDVETPQSRTCASCQHSSWDSWRTSKQKPPCAETATILGLVKETGLPRYFQVKGMGMKVLRNVTDRVQQEIVKYKNKGEILNLFDFYFTIASDRLSGPRGTYYAPRFDSLKRVVNIGQYAEQFREFVVESRRLAEQRAMERAAEQEVDNAIDTTFEV